MAMRLTLRYLLAFMDDHLLTQGETRLLQPEEFEAVGKKIQESEYARSLMDRIRDVVRRVRLGAPSDSDGGTGLDPNTVAEYLDNTLPDARVPDFEKVCLESDVHLAEVACCHQILAMVVTEAAEVPDATRERIYQLPSALVAQSEAEEALDTVETVERGKDPLGTLEAGAGVGPERGPRRTSRRSRVPEYLRASRGIGRWGWAFAALGLLVLVALALLWIDGSAESDNVLARLLPWLQTEEEQEASIPEATPETRLPPGATPPDVKESIPIEAQAPAPEAGEPPRADGSSIPAEGMGGESGKLSSPAEPQRPPSETPLPPDSPKEAVPAGPTATQQAKGHPQREAEPDAAEGTGSQTSGMVSPQGASEEIVGVVVSSTEVLLRQNPRNNVWLRLAGEASLLAGDHLLTLPAFRPQLALGGQVTLQLVGGTSLVPLSTAGRVPPGIDVQFGRILARAEKTKGATLRVKIGDRSWLCRFADPDSVVAIEVARTEASGDPETQPGPLIADVYVTSGSVVWQGGSAGKEIELKAPVRLTLLDRPVEPVVLQQVPRWVSGETSSALDQRAAAVLEREVVLGRSAMLALRELTTHRQREVRWLATRGLSLVEDYEPLLAALEDIDQVRYWSDYTDELRAAIFRNPQGAAKVRTTMEQHYGPQGAAIYEMFWRYRPDTLRPEDVNRLVDFLGNDSLPFRILSFWNLKSLYHNRTLYYRPEDPPARRQAAVQKWRELLKTSPTPRSSQDAPME